MGSPTGTPEDPPRVDVAADAAIRRPIVLAILVLAIVAMVTIVFVSTGASDGTCSDEDLQVARQIPSYGGVQLEFFDDPEGPGCVTALEVEASATEVLDHYREVLEEKDWDVSVREDTLVEGPEGAAVFELIAHRGESEVSIALESFDGRASAAIRVDA